MCIESSPEDSTEDQPIAKELCVLMAQEPIAHHLVCVCVCRPIWAAHSSHVAVCVYAAVREWVWSNNGLMIRERRIGAIFTLCT